MFGKTMVGKNGKTLRCNWKDALDEYFRIGNTAQVGITICHATIHLKDSQVQLAVVLSKTDSYSYVLYFSFSNFGLDYR